MEAMPILIIKYNTFPNGTSTDVILTCVIGGGLFCSVLIGFLPESFFIHSITLFKFYTSSGISAIVCQFRSPPRPMFNILVATSIDTSKSQLRLGSIVNLP